MQLRTVLVRLGAGLALLTVACKADETQGVRSADDESMEGMTTDDSIRQDTESPPPSPQAREEEPSEETQPTESAEKATPTDGEIAGIMAAADRREIEVSKIALDRSKDADVRRYASKMVKDHQRAIDRLDAVTSAAGITAATSEQSSQMDPGEMIERLRGLTGRELAQAYFGMMIEDHQKVLTFIDEQALPNVTIGEHRMAVDAHLQEANALAKKLEQGAPERGQSPKPGAS
jgi:putative membrane protein